LPGHGFTRGARTADLTLPGMARALAGLLAKLDLKPAIAIGHSAGVAVLLEMALSQHFAPGRIVGLNAALEPIRGNALLSPLAKLLFANPLTSRLVSFQARIGNMADNLIKATGSAVDNHRPRLLRHAVAATCPCQRRARNDGELERLEPMLARFGELKTPVTLIAAADDPMVADLKCLR
jgi:magnesium chelatase accessory protein